MKLTDFLSEETVLPDLKGDTKPELLRELASALVAVNRNISLDKLLAVLAERERLGSTAIGDGIAIPHGKLGGAGKIRGAFGRHRAGVDFESLDGNPTHLFFLLVAPEESTNLHLKALARVSRLLKNESLRSRLLQAPDAAAIFRLIKDEDAGY
ncbi:MAG: PTS sugar transporter subunit IIA [Candidatus Binataceae bacterium]